MYGCCECKTVHGGSQIPDIVDLSNVLLSTPHLGQFLEERCPLLKENYLSGEKPPLILPCRARA